MPKAQRRIGESERRFFSSTTTRVSGKFLSEQTEGFARSAAKLVDRLIRIAHRKNVCVRSGEQGKNFDLGKISVLEFIHQQKASAEPLLFKQHRIVLQQLICLGDHVAEGAQVFLPKHVFDSGENASNFLAALDNLRLLQLVLTFRAGHARKAEPRPVRSVRRNAHTRRARPVRPGTDA